MKRLEKAQGQDGPGREGMGGKKRAEAWALFSETAFAHPLGNRRIGKAGELQAAPVNPASSGSHRPRNA